MYRFCLNSVSTRFGQRSLVQFNKRPMGSFTPYKVVSSRLDDKKLSIDQLRRRLMYKAHYMGTRENILLLGSFAKQHVPSMDKAQLNQFADILQKTDWDLFYMIAGPSKEEALANLPEELDSPVMRQLVDHVHSGKVQTFS